MLEETRKDSHAIKELHVAHNMAKLSVVVPVYNGAERLPRLLDCFVAQTCRDFELVAIDDGSTDVSGAVLESYADRIPLRLIRKGNGGASSAYNRGLDEASGEFVFMLDQDDLLHPQAVEFMLRGMAESQADCLIFDYRDIDERQAVEVKADFAAVGECPVVRPLTGNVFRWFLDGNRNPGIWQFCFRREAIAGLRFVEGITLEDNLFVFPLLAKEGIRFAHLPVALYAYLQQPASIMHTSKLSWRLESFVKIFSGLHDALTAEDYRVLMTRHFVPELKSMWRAATFSGRRHFAGFMRRLFKGGLACPADFPPRWLVRFWLYGGFGTAEVRGLNLI